MYILLFSFVFSADLYSQSVSTNVNTDSLKIGDTFEYALTLQTDQVYENIVFPDTTSFPLSIDLIDRQQYKLSEFKDSLVYNLQFFGNEDLQIDELPIALLSEEDTSTIYTDPVLIGFKSVVAAGDSTLKPMKPIYSFPRAWWPWILVLLILAAFLLWWFKFREQPSEETAEPEPEIEPFYHPIKELEKKLYGIKEESDIAETKDFKGFYSEVGDAIRTYFEVLYKIPALESTSTELIRYLDAYGVDDLMIDKTRTVLRKADLVKFAKFTPTLDDAWKTFEEAEEFLQKAKKVDAARVRRLKKKYDDQFKPKPSDVKKEDS
ncbi:MAG: hypothetical protein RI561_09660 [Gracilimonas sp.]|nr:hypothetical protein [Gracilimonas sp.]